MKNTIIKIVIIVIVVLLVVGVYFIKKTTTAKNITDDTEIIINAKAVKMVNFVAPNCLACTKMEGLMGEIKKEYEGKAEIIEVDIMENQEIGKKYNIMYTPTQVFFDEEGNEIARHEGFIGKKDLVGKLTLLGVNK